MNGLMRELDFMEFEFDFGPISRTVDASTGKGNAINFASLPIHEVMTALLAGCKRDEFVAWLWHDLFKPLFWWRWDTHKFNWIHCPTNGKPNHPLNVEERWSSVTGIPSGLVSTHHRGSKRGLQFSEREIINNEFDQVAIGKNARFIQLAFLAEPATHTALLRAVIADAFMGVVTEEAAKAIEEELATGMLAFKRVRYVFDFERIQLSSPPTNDEIASLAGQYVIQVQNDELVIKHLTPLAGSDWDKHHVEVVIDLTAEPPTAERFDQGIISLVELLVVYQDSRTILMGIPQFLQVDIGRIKQQVKESAERRLRALDIRTLASRKELKKQIKVKGRVNWMGLPLIQKGQDVDLLAHVFDEQIEIRLIDRGQLTQRIKVRDTRGNIREQNIRWLNEIISWPVDLVQGKPRRCRFCGTAFDSVFPQGDAVVGSYFTDAEHVGFGGDICPMCRIYVLNSHKSRTSAEEAQGITGDRKGYRGAFAFLSPSSHFTYNDDQCSLVEQPPLDIGGRFASSMQRATVTLQEYGLFHMLSRRIIALIWSQLDAKNVPPRPLPLPYLGAILLTHDDREHIRRLFDFLEVLFKPVKLNAYPFEITVCPSVELTLEMAINDLSKHHSKHTYLKASPTIVSIAPQSKFTVLVDNGLQLEVSRAFFEDRKRVDELLEGLSPKRRRSWLMAILYGEDPLTATAEAFSDYGDQGALQRAERVFWDGQLSRETFAEQWKRYEEVRDEVRRIVARYPMLIEFFVKPRRR